MTIRAGQFGRLTTTTLGGGSESACCVSKTRMPAMNVPRSPPRSGWYARMNCLRRRSVSFIQPSPAQPPPHHRIALRRKAVTAAQSRSCPAVTVPRAPGVSRRRHNRPPLRPPKAASEPWRTLVPDIHPACDAGWFVRGGLAPGRRSPPSVTVTSPGPFDFTPPARANHRSAPLRTPIAAPASRGGNPDRTRSQNSARTGPGACLRPPDIATTSHVRQPLQRPVESAHPTGAEIHADQGRDRRPSARGAGNVHVPAQGHDNMTVTCAGTQLDTRHGSALRQN